MDQQPNNPLHGVTLKALLELLVRRYGWEGLASQVKVNCFANDPSVKSSLKFLRKHPWAREQVEEIYLTDLRRGLGPVPPKAKKKRSTQPE